MPINRVKIIYYPLKLFLSKSSLYFFALTLVATASLADGNEADKIRLAAVDFTAGLKLQNAGNYSKAKESYERAAAQGNAEAQTQLGKMYSNGQGVTRNDTTAAVWFNLASQQGDAEAQTQLGKMYANGRGVPKDLTKAIQLYEQASVKGREDAKKLLSLLKVNQIVKVEPGQQAKVKVEHPVSLPPASLSNVKVEPKTPATSPIADVSAKDSDGKTLLHRAALEGNASAVEALIKGGADKDAKTSV